MSMQNDPNQVLSKIREEIDDIDAKMHALLIQRSKVIDVLIEAKKQQGGGSAFRPGREASMMRVLAQRHNGNLPIDTIESIWRIIIATFTFIQAPYNVHLDQSEDQDLIWDSARFHFGFTVPLHKHSTAHHVIDAVTHNISDLGMVPVYKLTLEGAWWLSLIGPDKPKIIARLPFLNRPDHPTSKPYYVISKSVSEAMSRETVICALSISQWSPEIEMILNEFNCSLITSSPHGDRLCSLIELPQPYDGAQLLSVLQKHGLKDISIQEIGSHPSPYSI